jgi:hypothetical protein
MVWLAFGWDIACCAAADIGLLASVAQHVVVPHTALMLALESSHWLFELGGH